MISKKSETAQFRHSGESRNPVFSIGWNILDSRLRGNDDFLRDLQGVMISKKICETMAS
jgi:hypothetical protein